MFVAFAPKESRERKVDIVRTMDIYGAALVVNQEQKSIISFSLTL